MTRQEQFIGYGDIVRGVGELIVEKAQDQLAKRFGQYAHFWGRKSKVQYSNVYQCRLDWQPRYK